MGYIISFQGFTIVEVLFRKLLRLLLNIAILEKHPDHDIFRRILEPLNILKTVLCTSKNSYAYVYRSNTYAPWIYKDQPIHQRFNTVANVRNNFLNYGIQWAQVQQLFAGN